MFDGALNPTHIIIVLVIALLVLGPKRLPELGRTLGSGIRDFKSSFDAPHDAPDTAHVVAPPVEAKTEPETETETEPKPPTE
jgi:sec-independent protein translocase protein TatA